METRPDLPPRYYLDHFHDLLRFIDRHYAGILNAEEREFIDRFQELSADAQCLFVRLANRRPYFFRTAKLAYDEIDSVERAVEELLAIQFLLGADLVVGEFPGELLDVFTRAELAQKFPERKGSRKAELMEAILAEENLESLLKREQVVWQNHSFEMEKLTLMFFGTLGVSMEQFVLRDLGNLRFEAIDFDSITPSFLDRKSFDDLHAAYFASGELRELLEAEGPAEAFDYLIAWRTAFSELEGRAARLADKMTLRCGRAFERAKEPESALRCYRLTERPPSRERQVRLLAKLNPDDAESLALAMLDAPVNSEEEVFASDFLRKQHSPTALRQITERLKAAEVIKIDPPEDEESVESASLRWFVEQGYEGWFVENWIWRALLGLVAWEVLYEDGGTFNHPLQRGPADLYDADFFELRREKIQAAFDLLEQVGCAEKLAERWKEKFGTTNALVHWIDEGWETIATVLRCVPAKALRSVLEEMVRNLKANGRGFPDLFIVKGEAYAFVEIKSPSDHLSARQLRWLEFFDECGVCARLVRVTW